MSASVCPKSSLSVLTVATTQVCCLLVSCINHALLLYFTSELQPATQVEEGREVAEAEDVWFYTQEEVADLVKAKVTQAVKMAAAPLQARSVSNLFGHHIPACQPGCTGQHSAMLQ